MFPSKFGTHHICVYPVKFLHCFHTCVMHNMAGATLNMAGGFSNTLVRMESLFPKLTDVLSTDSCGLFPSEKAPTACQQLPLFSMICIEFK